ncbi:MAG: hypothetical protein JNM98_21675 [Rhodocyclaceae bacterium]|nr:hypothetical protein [Rhodocyclaceae bacterium]
MFGNRWLDLWRTAQIVLAPDGSEADKGVLLAQATWAVELAGFADQPKRIARALDDCRSRNSPPSLPEFLAMCRAAPTNLMALPEPDVERADPERVAAAIASTTWAMHGKKKDGPNLEPWRKIRAQAAVPGNTVAFGTQKLARGVLGDHGEAWHDGKIYRSEKGLSQHV